MAWPEISTAKSENRRELILNGAKINERIIEDGFDTTLFELTPLNYLSIHDSILQEISDDIGKLKNLQTLVLHGNKLEGLNLQICSLEKLKVLDLSRNTITELPNEISNLTQLDSLNLSMNQLEKIPDLSKNTKLAILNVSNNKIKDINDICKLSMSNLLELKLNGNAIEVVPENINLLVSLKNLDLSSNVIKVIPGELVDCNKLKDLNLKENPISDRRLLKLIDQCRTKQILDYIKQHCTRTVPNVQPNAKKDKKRNQSHKETEESVEITNAKYKIHIKYWEEGGLKILVKENVKSVRGYILGCVVHDIKFSEESFKKFIQLQTKLHDSICEKRVTATIATHDLKKLNEKCLIYTAREPKALMIRPLTRTNLMSGAELFAKLQSEADALRKEKKRNVYSGIHKYLYLLEGKKLYPCLIAGEEVVSFPPITNSDVTKISIDTTSLFLEVTSATSQFVCKKVLDSLVKEMIRFFDTDLHLEQVKNVDDEGNIKGIYPSRTDLVYEEMDSIQIVRN